MTSASPRPSTNRNSDRVDTKSLPAKVSYRIAVQNDADRTTSPDQLYSLFISLVTQVHSSINFKARPFLSGIINQEISTIDFGSKFIGTGRSFSVRSYHLGISEPGFAIKSVLPFGSFTSREEKQRLGDAIVELRTLSHRSLRDHPNIIELLGLCWETDATQFFRKWPVIILELADGGTLEDFLQRYPETRFTDRLALCQGVANGLLALHRCAIVHGDLKPANVLICLSQGRGQKDGWTAKLADFGGSVLDVEESKFGRLSMGSFPWQAPEWTDWLSRDGLLRTDVYSLGLTIWSVMARGREPVTCDIDLFDLDIYKNDQPAFERAIATKKLEQGEWFLQRLMLSGERQFAPGVDMTIVGSMLSMTVETDPSSRSLEGLCTLMSKSLKGDGISMATRLGVATDPVPFSAHVTQIRNIENILMAPDMLDVLNPTTRSYVRERLEDTYQRNSEPEKKSLSAFSLAVEALRRPEDSDSETKCLDWLTRSAQNGNGTARSLVFRFHRAFNQPVLDTAVPEIKNWTIQAAERNFPAAQEDLNLLATSSERKEIWATIRTRYANMGYNRFAFLYEGTNIISIEDFGRNLRDKIASEIEAPGFTQNRLDINSKGDNLFHFAASSGLDDVIKLWADHVPSNINTLGDENETALLHACRSGHFSTAMTLLNLGADPTLPSSNGDTPLHWLLSFEGSQARELGTQLTQAGGDIHAVAREITYPFSPLCSYEYGTPLHRAVGRGNLDAVKTLVDLGAQPDHSGDREDRRCSIYLSAMYHRADILSFLLEALRIEKPAAKPYKGVSLLIAAIHGRDIYGVKFTAIATYGAQWAHEMRKTLDVILEHGGSAHLHGFPSTFECTGSNPLIIATRMGIPEIVQHLLDRGCLPDINTRVKTFPGGDESTPLTEAIFLGRRAMFSLLLSQGADPSPLYFADDRTPLSTFWQCAFAGHEDGSFAQMLIDRGASMAETSQGYESAFALAVRNRSFHLARFLLENGADPRVEYRRGLYIESSELGTVLEFVIREQTRAALVCLGWLFKEVPDLSFVVSTQTQRTVLHICASAKIWSRNEASEGACTLIADALLKHFKPSKTQLNKKDIDGRTALSLAVMTNNYEMARILLEQGADPDILDAFQISPAITNAIMLELLDDEAADFVDPSDPRPFTKQIARKKANQTMIERYIKAADSSKVLNI